MTLSIGDFVQKVANPSVRGHVSRMTDGGAIAVMLAGSSEVIVYGNQIEWEEVPDEVMDPICSHLFSFVPQESKEDRARSSE